MTSEERIQKIKEHFANISMEEFEKNLEECGINEINSASEKGMSLHSYEELIINKLFSQDKLTYKNNNENGVSYNKLLKHQKYEGVA